MITVEFTSLLEQFFPGLKPVTVNAENLSQMIDELDLLYPGIAGYLRDEQGSLRPHVNIFINGSMLQDRLKLGDTLNSNDSVNIIQALSGG